MYFEEIDQDKGDTDIYGDSINDKEMFKGTLKVGGNLPLKYCISGVMT